MIERFRQTCFQIEAMDNVCTALADLTPGKVKVNGSATLDALEIGEPILSGHKIANRDIRPDEPIIKYGVTIGKATRLIHRGEWVHLHNCKSMYDERSAHLDPTTGAPSDTHYS
jgi:altronate dehydratase small subunit